MTILGGKSRKNNTKIHPTAAPHLYLKKSRKHPERTSSGKGGNNTSTTTNPRSKTKASNTIIIAFRKRINIMNLHTMYKDGMISGSGVVVEEVESGFQNRTNQKKKRVTPHNSGNTTKSSTGTSSTTAVVSVSNNTYTAIQSTAAVATAASADSDDMDERISAAAQQKQQSNNHKPVEPPGKPPLSPIMAKRKSRNKPPRELTAADYAADGLTEKEIAEEERRRKRKKAPLLTSPFDELVIDHSQQNDDDVSFITMPKAIRDEKDVTGRRIHKHNNKSLGEHISSQRQRKAPSISTSADTDNMANLMKLKTTPISNPMVRMSSSDEDDDNEVEECTKDIAATTSAEHVHEQNIDDTTKPSATTTSPDTVYLGNPTRTSLLSEDGGSLRSADNKNVAVDSQWETAMRRKPSQEIDLTFDEQAHELVGVHPQDKATAISPSAAAEPPQRFTSVEEDAIQQVKQQMPTATSSTRDSDFSDIHVVLPSHSGDTGDDLSSISQSHTHHRTLSTESPLVPPFFAPSESDGDDVVEQPMNIPKDPPSGFDENDEEKFDDPNAGVDLSESNIEEDPTESQRDEDDELLPPPSSKKKKRKKKKKKTSEGDSPKKKKRKQKKKKKAVDGDAEPSSPKKKKKKKKSTTSTRSVDRDHSASNSEPPPTPKQSHKPVSESTAATSSEDLTPRTASSKRLLAPFSWKGRKSYSSNPNHITMAGVTSSTPGRILEESYSLNDDDAIVNAMAQSSIGGAASVDGSNSPHPVRKRIFRFGRKKNQHPGNSEIDASTGGGVMSLQKSDHRPKQRKWYAPMKLKASKLSFKRRKSKPTEDAFQEMSNAAMGSTTGVQNMTTTENVVATVASPNSSNKADIDFHVDSDDA